jgi:Family of unknown function (DUF5681)
MQKSRSPKTRGRVRSGKSAPESSAIRLKVKGKPRGKSFEPGNGHGSSWRFKPGESGNPSGRPRHKEISKALRARLESQGPLPKRGRTGAEVLADKWFEQAENGNVVALASLADRAEGRAPISVGVSDGNAGLIALVAAVEELHPHLGSPEGHIPMRSLKEADLEGEVVGESDEEEYADAD